MLNNPPPVKKPKAESEPPATTPKSEEKSEPEEEKPIPHEPVAYVPQQKVSLFDNVLKSVTEFGDSVNIVLEDGNGRKISHTTPADDDTDENVAKLRWEGGDPIVDYHGLSFGIVNGKFTIFRKA